MTHPSELDSYAAGLLSPAEAAAIDRHLRGCRACAAEAASWRSVAAAVRAEAAAVPAPGATLFAAVRARLSPPRYEAPTYRLRARPAVAVRLAAAQLGILHPAVWPATALLLALGVTLAATGPDARAVDLLGLVAPLAGALALAALPAPDADPGRDVVSASGTSPRAVLLARLAVLASWTAGLAVFASLGLSALDASSATLSAFVAGWLGPFALLSAVSAVGAVVWRPTAGVAVAMALWGLRCLTRIPGTWEPLTAVVDRWWTTDVPVLVVAVLLLAAAVLIGPVNLPGVRRYSGA